MAIVPCTWFHGQSRLRQRMARKVERESSVDIKRKEMEDETGTGY
jgi:hypothetical protein